MVLARWVNPGGWCPRWGLFGWLLSEWVRSGGDCPGRDFPRTPEDNAHCFVAIWLIHRSLYPCDSLKNSLQSTFAGIRVIIWLLARSMSYMRKDFNYVSYQCREIALIVDTFLCFYEKLSKQRLSKSCRDLRNVIPTIGKIGMYPNTTTHNKVWQVLAKHMEFWPFRSNWFKRKHWKTLFKRWIKKTYRANLPQNDTKHTSNIKM